MHKVTFAITLAVALVACGGKKNKSDDSTSSDPKAGTRGTCSAFESDGKTLLMSEGAKSFDYKDCRVRLQARLTPVLCARGAGKQAYMHQVGDGKLATDTVECGGTTTTAASIAPSPSPTTAPAPAPVADVRVGGKGTCSALDASGKVLAVEPAPNFDYRSCRTRLQARLVPVLCKGPGKQSYMHKVSDGKLAPDTISCS